jgi:recombination protein RecA
MAKNEGAARLTVATKAIEKEYGHVVKWLGEAAEQKRETISTGCLGLDNAIGNGGLERGLVAEFFGGSGAGKSFLSYSVIKNACEMGYKCAIVDAENSVDPSLLINVGLPEDQVLVVEGAATGEANLEIADNLMQTGEFAVVVVDSVAALVPKARTEDDYDQATIGLHARLMSAGLQKILPVAKRTNTLLIFINQIRNKIGSYGNPQTTTGGEALPFYASYRIEVIGSPQQKSRRLSDEGTGEVYGHKTTFRVVKNRRAAPYREAEVDLIYGIGYDTVGELLDIGIDVGLVERAGAWYTFGENRWQGRDKAKLALQGDEELAKSLQNQLRSIISGEAFVEPESAEETVTEEEVDDKPARKKRTRKPE